MRRNVALALSVSTAIAVGLPLQADWPAPNFRLRNQIKEFVRQAEGGTARDSGISGLTAMIEDESVPDDVREEAIVALGGVAGHDEENYLRRLADKGETRREFRVAAALALWMARLRLAQSESEELALLSESLSAKFDGRDFTHARRWGAEILCDRGEMVAPERIMKAFDRAYDDRRAAEELAVCEMQASLIKSSRSAEEAYLSALELPDSSSRRSLHAWALRHLEEVKDQLVASRLLAYAVRMEASDHPFDMEHGVTAAKVVLALGVGRDALIEAGLKQQTVERAEYRFQFPHEGQGRL